MAEKITKLQQIPGIGDRIAHDLNAIGIKSPVDLKNKNPESIYERLCNFKASPVDRCMLYVLRGAVYFVSTKEHDPELLKWWNWKDKR
jgi:hypothetical protein